MSSSDYSDDFEDYTDDFEAYESDQGDDHDHRHEASRHAQPHHLRKSQHCPAPSPPPPRPLSAAKSATTSPPRGGLGCVVPNAFAHGVRAPSGFGLGTMAGGQPTTQSSRAKIAAAAAAESARVKAIRKLVSFEYVNFTLLDMGPKSRYELALLASARVDGGGNRFQQKETQTGSDLIEVATETEATATAEAEAQCPDDVAIVAPTASGGSKGEKKDKKKGSSKRTNSGLEWTPQLTRFVLGASQVFDSILSMTAAAEAFAAEVHDPHAGLVELLALKVPNDHKLTTIHMSEHHPHLLAYSLSSTQTSSARSTIHIASLKSSTSSTLHTLTCWGSVSTLFIAPHPRWLVLAGTTDGAVLAWDSRKSASSKRTGSDPLWASYSLLLLQPQQTHHHVEQEHAPDPIHSAPIVAIHPLTDRSVVTVDELGKAAVWGISLSPASSVSLVPVTSPTAMSLFPRRIRPRHQVTQGDLDAVPYPLVTALDPSSSAGMLVATASGTIVRAPAELLVMSTDDSDGYVLPKSAGTVTCMAIVAREWVVVGTAGGQVVVFHMSRGAAPEVVWNVYQSNDGEEGKATLATAVVGMYFPRVSGAGPVGEMKKVVAVTRRSVVSWRTEPGKWEMEHMVTVPRPRAGKEDGDKVQMASGKMVVWEQERGAAVVYNLPMV